MLEFMIMELEKVLSPSQDGDTRTDIAAILSLREQISTLTRHLGHDLPRVDLLENDEYFRLIVELPGVSQDNLEIAVQGAEVTIAAIRESFEPDETSSSHMILRERSTGIVQRSISLSAEVDRHHATAHLREGLLVLLLPKLNTAHTKGRR